MLLPADKQRTLIPHRHGLQEQSDQRGGLLAVIFIEHHGSYTRNLDRRLTSPTVGMNLSTEVPNF
jgi:hypothetical protein